MKIWSLLALCFGLAFSATAKEKIPFADYVSALKQEAAAKGIQDEVINAAFEQVKYRKKAVKADKNQPEFKLTLDTYLPRAVPDWKSKQAIEKYKENQELLEKVGAHFGVQPRFIVALWGVESNFGRLQGNYDVVSALTTLAYDGRREALFKKQLFAALRILQDKHIALDKFKGSWAGAMGQCQFMPTSFLAYAYDFDGDGKKDIWNNKADVFASIANYLSSVGWNDQLTWGRQVKLPATFDYKLAGLNKKKMKPLSEWQALGVRRYDGSDLPTNNIKASLIMPDDEKGRIYLVYSNYHSLMNWNRSTYFGSAVGLLSDKIKKGL